jgi:hypothetical protein
MDMVRYMLYLLENMKVLNANPGGVANELLSYFGQTAIASSYQCYKKLNEDYGRSGRSIAYKNVHKRIKKLYSIGLIDKVKKNNAAGSNSGNINDQNGKHGAIYYSLTQSGLFYIVRKRLLTSDLRIILEHKKNTIFDFYLFSIMEIRTIEKLTDFSITDKIFTYLRDCCQTVEKVLNSLEQMNRDHGYHRMLAITDILVDPVYQSDPHGGSRRFIEHLRDKFKINWLEERNTKIIEIRKNRIIKFCNGKNELVLRIYPEKNKGILLEGKTKIAQFIVEELSKDSFLIQEFIPSTAGDYLQKMLNSENFYFHHEM